MLFRFAFFCVLLTTLHCASDWYCNCNKNQPSSTQECVNRVTDAFGKSAKFDPFVDLNYDGQITGADWTLCRELNK